MFDATGDGAEDDLHLMMAVAVLSGQRGVDAETRAIFEAWERFYPDDALGRVGTGLAMIRYGDHAAGYGRIEEAAEASRTRADQARDVLATLRRDLDAAAG